VKVAVAIALGLGTMIGWKRIVVTVGEKIGKDHLTYGRARRRKSAPWLMIGAADMLRAAGEYDARAVVGRGRHDGGEPLRALQMSTVKNLRWPGCSRCRALRCCFHGSLFWLRVPQQLPLAVTLQRAIGDCSFFSEH
jgi:hypothetical protein